MTSKLRSLVFNVAILLIFFSVNISYADDDKFIGKIETATGQEYEGKITLKSTTGVTKKLKVLYQGESTLIQLDEIKTIELLDPGKKEWAFELKTGKKFIVNSIKRMTPLFNVYIDQDIGKINIANDKIKKITFYETLQIPIR
jgi:hypothetical protein